MCINFLRLHIKNIQSLKPILKSLQTEPPHQPPSLSLFPCQDSVPFIKKGDVIGCALDLTVPIITFYVNGRQVNGAFTGFNLDGMFFPVVSASAKLR